MHILVIQRFPARNIFVIVLVDVTVWLSVAEGANSQTCKSRIQDVTHTLLPEVVLTHTHTHNELKT